MITHKLNYLLNNLCNVSEDINQDITGLALDSRLVRAGDLFFAYQGTHLDGRQFIADAITKGARAIVIEGSSALSWNGNVPVISIQHLRHKIGNIAMRFYGGLSLSLPIVGVTGTNGKTSLTHFIASGLQKLDVLCGVIGTLGSGIYGDIQAGNLTTPDAITLHKTFAEFYKQGAKAIAMEVSSHSIDQGRINGIKFAVGIFTNLTRDHLDYHGTLEAYGQAKRRLFAQAQLSVINADDDCGLKIIESLVPQQKVFAYSVQGAPPILPDSVPLIRVEDVTLNMSGTCAKVLTPWGCGEIRTRLIGRFNLSNILAALTTLCLLKYPFENVLTNLAQLIAVPGRMQAVGGGNKPLVIVDYAHTPDALEKVLVALRQHCQGKLFCIFGCGGDRDKGKRPMMAKAVAIYADHIVVTDDNPRTEDPECIVADILQGFPNLANVIVQHDRSKAIKDVIQYAQVGDCVLVAGKGAETSQQIGERAIPFSDMEKVKESLGC